MVYFTIALMANGMCFQVKTQEAEQTPAEVLKTVCFIQDIMMMHTPCGYISSRFYDDHGASKNTLTYLNHVLKTIMSVFRSDVFSPEEQKKLRKYQLN